MSNIINDLGLDEDDIKWYQFAACNNMDTNWFYDSYETDVQVAIQTDNMCILCPVSKMCLREGLENREFGVWGGVYLNLGRIEKSANSHKTDEIWGKLRDIHGKHIIQ